MFLSMRLKYVVAAMLLLLLIAACGPAIPQDATATPEPTETTAASVVTPEAAATQPAQPATITENGQQWNAPPPMVIDPAQLYQATFKTEKGDIVIELFASHTPRTVNNLVFLAREGYYDGTTFHRVLDDFMAQGGDPTGTGMGGPGYRFEDEIISSLSFDDAGYLAMANSGPGTNGSQFFITFAPTPFLNGRHTIFGKVVAGMDVLDDITRRDPEQNPDFTGDVLETIVIEEISESALPPLPELRTPVLEEGRPLAFLEPVERENLYDLPPDMIIDTDLTYVATVETTQGDITIHLYPQDAPDSVNNFYVLASLGYWDDFPIVFADPSLFVITGSPGGRPDSDVGYTLPSELNRTNTTGAVGFYFDQNRNGSSGSQFYILLEEGFEMDAVFTVFGMVIDGLEVAQALTIEDFITTITVEPLETE